MRKAFEEDYYLGLDIGTNSVGWAVTDVTYNILKINGKAMWGVRLFDEAETAENRRIARSTRRRYQRRRQRIQLLQELFAEEISKVDPGFFQRLKDSPMYPEDKMELQTNSLFAGNEYNDFLYHKEYPTVHHLRKALLEKGKVFDVRLVYLAVHNILKYRGHFIFEGNDMGTVTSFQTAYSTFSQCILDELDIELDCIAISEVEETLKNKTLSKSAKKRKLMNLFNVERSDTQLSAMLGLVSGLKVHLSDLFSDDSLKESEKPKLSFTEGSYDETRAVLDDILQERCIIIDKIKSLYDWAILAEVLEDGNQDGKAYLSVAKVAKYNKHHDDLKLLKSVIRRYCTTEQYKRMFNEKVKSNDNYCAYTGYMKNNGKKVSVKRCKEKADFYKYVTKTLESIDDEDKRIDSMLTDIQQEKFMPLQVTTRNNVIPYQVHRMELIEILDNAASYLSFLNETDECGITAKDKIIKIFEFRIPYYVGPLNTTHSENSWAKRKESGVVRPWNFEKKIDVDASAEAFMRRMTNKCTYLLTKDVVPKYSLLYSEFMVWNELNNVRIKQEKLPIKLKQYIYKELFQKYKNITGKRLLNFLLSEGYEISKDDLSGFDGNFKSSLVSYNDFKNQRLFGKHIDEHTTKKIVEDIILWITLYGEDKRMLVRVIRSHYSNEEVSDAQIKEICKLNYNGWGRFSKEFLLETIGADRRTGECMSIIQALRDTNDNLMQLLGNSYTFMDAIEEENLKNQNIVTEVTYDSLVKDIVASPAIKRAIWQVLKITEEIQKITDKIPRKIFIEMARGRGEKKRTDSRKRRLIQLYDSCKTEGRDWKEELEKTPESNFRSIKLYLYYTQMGRCMYSGKSIELSQLANTNIYDRDHIYPQSKTKDDSLDNLVLVNKEYNAQKSDNIISLGIQRKMGPHWKMLKSRGLISQEKYDRLTRKTPLTNEELAGFINRQLVEARQSSKLVASLLRMIYKDSDVVYVKAKSVSDFRQEKLEMVKVRDISDYHHAKDAYLNILVGNVYHTKFTSNPMLWLKKNPTKEYSLNRMFDFDLYDENKAVWKRGNNGTMALVRRVMRKNDILVTRNATCNKGQLFDQLIVSKNENPTVPIKTGMDMTKYGGYKGIKPAYFMLVESTDKRGKKLRSFETVPLYLLNKFENNTNLLVEYCKAMYGLKDPRIIIPRIKKNAYMKINGFPMNIRGTTGGGQIIMQGAVQLCLDEEHEIYIKKVLKYLQKNANRKDKKIDLPINKYDGITNEENLSLYDAFLVKHKNSIYINRPAKQITILEEGREKFLNLELEKQCIVLEEILHLFQCKPLTADLRLIGGSKTAGKMQINNKISSCTSAKLIHQSPTGIFEQEIDLLTI